MVHSKAYVLILTSHVLNQELTLLLLVLLLFSIFFTNNLFILTKPLPILMRFEFNAIVLLLSKLLSSYYHQYHCYQFSFLIFHVRFVI